MNASLTGSASCHVKQFQSMPRDLCIIYREVGRPCLPRDYRENSRFAWIFLPPFVAAACEIDRLRENSRPMRYVTTIGKVLLSRH